MGVGKASRRRVLFVVYEGILFVGVGEANRRRVLFAVYEGILFVGVGEASRRRVLFAVLQWRECRGQRRREEGGGGEGGRHSLKKSNDPIIRDGEQHCGTARRKFEMRKTTLSLREYTPRSHGLSSTTIFGHY